MVTVNIGGAGGDPDTPFPKDVTVALLDAVFIDGAGVMIKALASAAPTPPSVGFVSKVVSPTAGELRTEKLLSGFIGLPVGTPVYLSDTAPGGITPVPPSALGTVVQRLGVAVSPTTILIEPTDTERTVNG